MRFSFKMRTVKCPDGSTKSIYRDPGKAFPLALREVTKKAAATVEGLQTVSVGASAEIQHEIGVLLVQIDETNKSMQADFAASYQAYASDPCFDPGYLHRRVEQLIGERKDFQHLLLQAQVIKNLVSEGKPSGEILELLKETRSASVATVVTDAKAMIDSAPDLVDAWAGGEPVADDAAVADLGGVRE